jgi:hypothetical protein
MDMVFLLKWIFSGEILEQEIEQVDTSEYDSVITDPKR